MSSIIVGSPISGAKVLQRQNFQRDINGLETITETYKIRTADRSKLAPEKDTIHASFSSFTLKYSRMAVETISFGEEDGGLTSMNVVYVGLTSSTGLPPAIIRFIPTFNAGIYGSPLTIEAEFITDMNENELALGQTAAGFSVPQSYYYAQQIVQMPSQINGVTLPGNPRATGETFYSIDGRIIYLGYCVDGVESTKRGQFLVAKMSFKEKQIGIGLFYGATRL